MCRRTLNIDGKAEYSWRQAHALYLVKSAGCSVLRAASTKPGECYQQQLSRALKQKRSDYAKRRDKVIFQRDNAQAHVAKPIKETLEALKWDVLLYSLYFPDIAPSDYHLFRSMTHGLSEQRFHSYEDTKKWIHG